MREWKSKLHEIKNEITLIKVIGEQNVTHESGNLDVEASMLAPINTAQNFGVNFDPELSFKKQIRYSC